jgi:hypothetical protein
MWSQKKIRTGSMHRNGMYSVNGILIFRVPEYSELSIRVGIRSW